ncbi:MAG: right-handed parallel beta-helix repeat-containing protein, partial [Candidatus Levybacteria bacterium]|nr:right-handed parallel beta-helix repeat-containing protein [Candidatus Levybacteria bacterium]
MTGPVECSLSDIKAIKPSAPLDLVNSTNKTWLLKANLKLEQGATLLLHGSTVGGDVNELRLKSNNTSTANSTVFVRAQWGTIDIDTTKITSWNEASNSPDTEYSTYKRSYIHVRSYLESDGITKRESRMDIKSSDVGYLGFYAAESYGLSWKVLGPIPAIFDKVNVYGNVINSRIHHNYFGMYTFGAYGMNITNNEVDNSIQYGIDPHDDSDSLVIENNNSHHNGNHGIICSQRCDHLTIRGNISRNNKGNGIMLHRNTNDSLVENNQVLDNSDAGIAVFDSHKNTIRSNISLRNNHGIRLSVASSENLIEQNEFGNNKLHGIYFYKGSDAPTTGDGRPKLNSFTNNNVHDNGDYVIKLKEADGNTFENNSFTGSNREIYMYNASSNVFRNNTFTGTNNFYYARYLVDNTIADTNPVRAKIGDSQSSLQVTDSSNFIFQNNKNIPTIAEPFLTSILLTRAITSGVVDFTRLNFQLIPTSGQVTITPLVWEVSAPFYKKWVASSSASTTTANHTLGDLNPGTKYDVLVNDIVWNSYIASTDGTL